MKLFIHLGTFSTFKLQGFDFVVMPETTGGVSVPLKSLKLIKKKLKSLYLKTRPPNGANV